LANSFREKRFLLDTAGTTLLRQALAPGESINLRIKGIRWVGATTAGHACVIQDEDGVVYWESLATGANYVESDLMERTWQKDFKLTTLASGRVYIYLYAGSFS
jgi:hypothetical protein